MVSDQWQGFGRKCCWFGRSVLLAIASRCCARRCRSEGSLSPVRGSHLPNTALEEHDSCTHQVSAVYVGTRTRAGQPRNLGSIPCSCLRIICFPKHPVSLSCPPILFIEDRESVPGCKVAGTWFLALILFSAEDKDGWSYKFNVSAWRPQGQRYTLILGVLQRHKSVRTALFWVVLQLIV
jgi:hypothetical protein